MTERNRKDVDVSVDQDPSILRSRAGKPMTDTERNEMWVCAWCNKFFPVPVLARECEDRHLE